MSPDAAFFIERLSLTMHFLKLQTVQCLNSGETDAI